MRNWLFGMLAMTVPAGVDAVTLRQAISGDMPQLMALYRDLHANPELSMVEHRTSAKLAAEARKLGFEVTEKVGGTGVVAVLKNGPGPVLLIRADMDALPLEGADRPAVRVQGPCHCPLRCGERRDARLRSRHAYGGMDRHRPPLGGDEGSVVRHARDDSAAGRRDW
jgi:hypothetical protein